MDDQSMQQAPTKPPKISEFEHKVRQLQECEISMGEFKTYLKIEHAKVFDNGFKYALLIQMRQLEQNMKAYNMHYGKPCSDQPPGHDDKHNIHDLGDPCYCGSDNCVICLDCGEENHD